MQYLDAISKNRMVSVGFQGKPFNNTEIQVYALTSDAEKAEDERFYEDLQNSFRTNIQKRYPFHYWGLNLALEHGMKEGKVLPRKCTAHSKHPLPTTQEKTLHMDITRWSTPKSD